MRNGYCELIFIVNELNDYFLEIVYMLFFMWIIYGKEVMILYVFDLLIKI